MKIDAGNFQECLARIADRGKITAAEALAILQHVSDRAETLHGEADPIMTAAKSIINEVKTRARNDRLDALRNTAVRQARTAEATEGGIGGAIDKLRGRLYWTPGTDPAGNSQTLSRAIANDWLGAMHGQLVKAGLLKVAANPAAFRDVARALSEMRNIEGPPDPNEKNPFRKIAQIIAPVQEAMRQRQNAEGARIADAKDWVATTSHDPLLMRRGGRGQEPIKGFDDAFKAWWDHERPLWDEKTFADLVPRDGETEDQARTRFARSVFEAKTTGVHLIQGERPENMASAFEGSRNIARKISEGRVIFYKDADAWSDHMERYGAERNWYSLMTGAATRAARNSALMHFWGTNPAANLALVTRSIAEKFRSIDPDGVTKFLKNAEGSLVQPGIRNVMAQLDGSASIPANQMWHSIGTTVRAFYDMAYLGFVAGTHAGSLVATFPSEARFHGIGKLKAFGELAASLVRNNPDALEEMGSYGEGISRHGFDAFAHGWNFPGYVAAAHNRFMSATLLPYLFEHSRAGMREMLANNLGRKLGGDLEAMPPLLRRTLNRYGIGADEWRLLQTTTPLKTPNGRVYLTPHSGLEIDGSAAEAHLKATGTLDPEAQANDPGTLKAVSDLRRNIADGLAMYYQDAADHSTVTGGVRERAMLVGNTKPGSWQRELLQLVMQFKTWPLAAMHQTIGREYFQRLSAKSAVWGVGGVIGLSMLGGYMRMTAHDLLSGLPPRTPKNSGDAAKIALASLAQGGGLGIFGDFLFGEANRFGSGIGATVGGPAAGDAAQLYGIYNHWLQSIGTDQRGDVWPELAKFAVGHIPFGNLFYLKGAADYLLWYHMFEAMHPGWWARTNRRMEKTQGRMMAGYSPGRPIPYTPFGIGGSTQTMTAGLH